jgi:hypothetical protein
MAEIELARPDWSVRGAPIAATAIVASLWIAGGLLFAISAGVVYGNDWFLGGRSP